jgi:hypothetical protein
VGKPAMTYQLNKSFFNNLNTPAQAYVLGFFYFRGNGILSLPHDSIDTLYIIKELIEYTGPIHIYRNRVELRIYQKDFLNTLISLGAVPGKKYVAHFPSLSVELLPHFIRAIFESYGNIRERRGHTTVSITLDEQFINGLRSYLRNLNIHTKHYYRYAHTNTIEMFITNSKHAAQFLNLVQASKYQK